MKYGGESMANSLCTLFNWILDAGHTPEQWGKALVILLYKKGDPTDPGNYRGISLLVVGKVFTRLVAERIENAVKDIIAKEQAGYTAGKGCIEHIYVLNRIIQARKKKGKILTYSSWTFGKHLTQSGGTVCSISFGMRA
jgi:hypothetical protein